jgi:GDP-L-fucose synthase
MDPNAKVYVAGHRGLAGAAIMRQLEKGGYRNLVMRTHAELDLTDQHDVRKFFQAERPEYVLLAAAKVGGIAAHASAHASFIIENIRIQNNVIDEAYRTGVRRLLFLGSSCIYPRECPQPIREDYLLTGALEPTNRPYAVAKMAGVETCGAYNRQYNTQFLAVMPTNLYGARDNYDSLNSHVLPALIRKIHMAKVTGAQQVVVWGTGSPRREFLFSDDMGEACVFLMELSDHKFLPLVTSQTQPPLVNVGWGRDVTIRELAEIIMDVIGYCGEVVFDSSKPDGTPRKMLDIARLTSLGWKPTTKLRNGIAAAYECFLKEHPDLVSAARLAAGA